MTTQERWREACASVAAYLDADVDGEAWWPLVAALDPERSRPTVVVLNAGEGAFGACLAVFLGGRAAAVAILDERYFRPRGVDLSRLEAFAATFPAASRLVARRDAASGGQAAKVLRGLLDAPGCAVVAVEAAGLAALRAARLFARGSVERLVVGSAPPPPLDALRVHARARALYAPTRAGAFAAKDARDDAAAWLRGLRDACVGAGGAAAPGPAALAFAKDGGAPPDAATPLVLFLPDQLDALRADVEARVARFPKLALDDGAAAALVASAPGRYGAGGYAAAHYVKADPGAREPCFELEVGGARLGFVSIGFSEFGAAAAPGAAWPFRDVTRPYNVATVSRLVVLDGARGRGAATALLSACAAFHDLGVPCRVATRKRAVAEKVLARLGVLAADDAKAAAAHRATRADDAARAVVLFDPALAGVARRDTTPLAPKERGKNLTWNFWYTGAPLLHPTTRAPYAFVGGRARFAPADGPPEPP